LAQGWSVHYRTERESFITHFQPVGIEKPFITQQQYIYIFKKAHIFTSE